eukprot:5150864-Pyramimonas_sp.AAC.1
MPPRLARLVLAPGICPRTSRDWSPAQVKAKAKSALATKAAMLKEATAMLEGAVARAEAAEAR